MQCQVQAQPRGLAATRSRQSLKVQALFKKKSAVSVVEKKKEDDVPK